MTEATQGPLICDVAYPINAPGSAYDPTLIAGLTMNPEVVNAFFHMLRALILHCGGAVDVLHFLPSCCNAECSCMECNNDAIQ